MLDALRRSNWPAIALAAILITALAARLQGIAFGLPYVAHPDEPVNFNVVVGMLHSGSYNPEFFNYPSLPFYAYLFFAKVVAFVGEFLGYYDGLQDIRPVELLAMGVGEIRNPRLFLAMRLLTVLVGVATVWMVYRCGLELASESKTGRWIGLAAAAMAAVSPGLVANSRYIAPDAWGTLFVVLSVWAALRVFRSAEPRYYLYAGTAAGLAAGAKYVGGLVVLAVPAAHILREQARGALSWRSLRLPAHLILSLVLSLLVFFLTTPFAILDLEAFLVGFLTEALHYASGHPGMEGETLAFYGRLLLFTEGPGAVLGLAGLAYGFAKQPRLAALLCIFPAVYFFLIVDLPVRNDRTFMPVLPFLFLAAANMCVRLGAALPTAIPGVARPTLLLAVAVAVLSLPVARTTQDAQELTRVDAAAEAREWIAGSLPDGARIVIESYSPYVDPGRFQVHGVFALGDGEAWDISGWTADYLIVSSRMYGRFVNSPDRYPEAAERYARIFETFDLLKGFSDGRTEIRIYRVEGRSSAR